MWKWTIANRTFYSSLHARMDKKADNDKTYSKCVNEDKSVEEEQEADRLANNWRCNGQEL